MKKIILVILLIFAVLSIIIFMNQNNKKQGKVCFKDNCFEVEIAITPQEKKTGLMFRKDLDENKGMIFVYEQEGEVSIWMKNMLFPIDIIWINKDKEVVFINKDTSLCEEDSCFGIKPEKRAKYVLELKAGISEKIGLKTGDRLEISL